VPPPAQQVTQADAVIGSRPYLKLSAEVAKPGARLRWVQTTTAGVDQAVPPDLLAAEHVTVTCINGPPGPLMAEHAVQWSWHGQFPSVAAGCIRERARGC